MAKAVFFWVTGSLLLLPLGAATVVGAGYVPPTPVDVAPGQILTFYVEGIGRDVTTAVRASSIPLPKSLVSISATFVQGAFIAPVPMLSVEPVSPCARTSDPGCNSDYIAITVQIPFGFDFSDPTVIRGVPVVPGQIRFSENDAVVASVDVTPVSDRIHVLRSCDGLFANVACSPIVTHADGSSVDLSNPAKSGETVVVYAVGLGVPNPSVPAGESPASPVATPTSISFDWAPNSSGSRPTAANVLRPAFAGMIPGYAGLYQINVVIPLLPAGTVGCDGTATGTSSNLTINIVGHSSVDGARICVSP